MIIHSEKNIRGWQVTVKVTASSNRNSKRMKLSDLRISRPALEVTWESSHFSPQVTIKIPEKSLSRGITVHRISIQSFLYLSPSFINSIQTPRWPAARPPSPFWSNFLKMPLHMALPSPLLSQHLRYSVLQLINEPAFQRCIHLLQMSLPLLRGGSPWGNRQKQSLVSPRLQ